MSKQQHHIAIIGRAFAGTALVEDLHLQFEKLGISSQSITYFGPEDVGLAYRASDPTLILNRPTSVMNAFEGEWGDYHIFLKAQHDAGAIDTLYNNKSFPPRGTFGNLITHINTSHDARYAAIGNHVQRIEQFVIGVTKEADGTYTLALADGTTRSGFTKIVNATGHEVVQDTDLKDHAKIISPYVDAAWENKIRLAKTAITQDGGEIVLVGGGGTSLDAGVLAAYDSRARLRIFSEYGDTTHHFHAGVSANPVVTQAIRAKLDGFFDNLGEARNVKAVTGDKIRAFLAEFETANPRTRIGNGEYTYPENYIYPQFVLAELLADKRIRQPENDTILKGVIAFNGNPIAPERLKLWETLQAQGRIVIESKRVTVKKLDANKTLLFVDGEETPRQFDGFIIRADEIRRGAVLNEQGIAINPALHSQFEQGLNGVSTTDPRVLPVFARDPNIINVGATTYGDANSVKIFRTGTQAAAIQIASEIVGSISAPDFLKLLEQRRKDGGTSIRILDVREQGENADVEILPHASLSVHHLPFKTVINTDGFNATSAQAALANDNVPTFVICAGGIRSAKAIEALREQGYRNLINVDGGISALIPEIRSLQQLDYFAGQGVEKNRAAIASGGTAAVDPCGGGSVPSHPGTGKAAILQITRAAYH